MQTNDVVTYVLIEQALCSLSLPHATSANGRKQQWSLSRVSLPASQANPQHDNNLMAMMKVEPVAQSHHH